MAFDVDAVKELAENPDKEKSLQGSIPKFLKMAVSSYAENQEVNQKTALAAIVHEGLTSETLEERITDYTDGVSQ